MSPVRVPLTARFRALGYYTVVEVTLRSRLRGASDFFCRQACFLGGFGVKTPLLDSVT